LAIKAFAEQHNVEIACGRVGLFAGDREPLISFRGGYR
jgi:hypothetical protein